MPTLFRHEANSPPAVSHSPVANDGPDRQEDARVTQSLAVPSNESALKEDLLPEPPVPAQILRPPDEKSSEIHRTIVVALDAKVREATKGFYAGAFRELHLPADLQEKVIPIFDTAKI